MAENINVSRFRNGDSIPEVRSPEEWTKYGSEGKAACCIIQNDRGNAGKYGRLYNWYALADPRGFAPKGWHVPSDEEWTGLTNYLGNGVAAALKMRAPGSTDQGNESGQKGFCGLPGGARAVNGEFYGLTSYGYWWSSTETSPATALIRILSYVDCDIHFFDYSKSCGISVRCIRN